MDPKRPFFVIVPGASQNPTHYGYLAHLLQLAGYPTFSAILPSVGSNRNVTVQDDADYVRDQMLIPVLDHEERDVIILTHSYSSLPVNSAVEGFSKPERTEAGKKTGILGQIHLATLLYLGGDGKSMVDGMGGHLPGHIREDQPDSGLLRCDDRIPPLYGDVPEDLARQAVAVSAMAQGKTSFNSPVPAAAWASEKWDGRRAYIRTMSDATFPKEFQQGMIAASGVEWIVRDIESGHSPNLSKPDTLKRILLELALLFEGFGDKVVIRKKAGEKAGE